MAALLGSCVTPEASQGTRGAHLSLGWIHRGSMVISSYDHIEITEII